MPLKWKTVSAEHVAEACRRLATRSVGHPKRKGLVVYHEERVLPAKDVLREAYRIANGLSDDTPIKFSSGDGTLNVLRVLGFHAERLDQ